MSEIESGIRPPKIPKTQKQEVSEKYIAQYQALYLRVYCKRVSVQFDKRNSFFKIEGQNERVNTKRFREMIRSLEFRLGE